MLTNQKLVAEFKYKMYTTRKPSVEQPANQTYFGLNSKHIVNY